MTNRVWKVTKSNDAVAQLATLRLLHIGYICNYTLQQFPSHNNNSNTKLETSLYTLILMLYWSYRNPITRMPSATNQDGHLDWGQWCMHLLRFSLVSIVFVHLSADVCTFESDNVITLVYVYIYRYLKQWTELLNCLHNDNIHILNLVSLLLCWTTTVLRNTFTKGDTPKEKASEVRGQCQTKKIMKRKEVAVQT